MIEEKNKKKNKVIKGIALLGLFLMVFGISYALFRVTLNGKKTNKIKTGKFDLLITNRNGTELETEGVAINQTMAMPMTSKDGMETTPYEFDLYNPGDYPVKYTLYFSVPDNADNIPDDKIKYNLKRIDNNTTISRVANTSLYKDINNVIESEEDNDPDLNSVFNSLILKNVYEKEILDDETNENHKLYKVDLGVIGAKQRQQYEFRMWIHYGAGTEINDKSLEGKMAVYGTQISRNDVYPVRTINITSKEIETLGMLNTMSLYSDNSIRYNSECAYGGTIDDIDSAQDQLMYDYNADIYMPQIKAGFIEYYRELSPEEWAQLEQSPLYEEFISNYDHWYNVYDELHPSEGLENSDPELYAKVGSYVEQTDELIANAKTNMKYNGNYYVTGELNDIGEGGVSILSPDGTINLYLTSKIQVIGPGALTGNFKTITFLEDGGEDMTFDRMSLRSGYSNLEEITFPSNLKTFTGNWHASFPKANITLKFRAKQADVSYSDVGTGFKAVEWLNG